MTRRQRPRPSVAAASAILVAASLAAAGATATAAPSREATGVGLTGRTAVARVVNPTVLLDRGTVRGSPIGSGRITLVHRLRPRGAWADTKFKIVTARGTVSGRARSTYSVHRLAITLTGAAVITGGTGAYRGMRSGPLAFDAIRSTTGRREIVALTGRATLPTRRKAPR